MRGALRAALMNDPWLRNALAIDDNNEPIIVANAGADSDLILPCPHLILRMGVREIGVGSVFRRGFEVWAHDNPGDYEVIDSILNRCRQVLTAITAVQAQTGNWISCVEWQDDSEDLFDEGPGTITRNSRYTVIGSGG